MSEARTGGVVRESYTQLVDGDDAVIGKEREVEKENYSVEYRSLSARGVCDEVESMRVGQGAKLGANEVEWVSE